mmetsp:Transcript_33163/g.74910  ORF Transcript_33163/g.74910 Transcript_33163/m.74910 type:complete len:236 (-) Transcript_33163:686-1393(-)
MGERLLRQGLLHRVPARLGQVGGGRARPPRRHPHGRHLGGDPAGGAAHPGRPGQPCLARGPAAPGGTGVVPGQRVQDGPGDPGLRPGREPAAHHLRQLAWVQRRDARHGGRDPQVRRHDCRRPRRVRAPRPGVHPAQRRAPRRRLGGHRPHHQLQGDGDVLRQGVARRDPRAPGDLRGEVPRRGPAQEDAPARPRARGPGCGPGAGRRLGRHRLAHQADQGPRGRAPPALPPGGA